MYNEDRKLEFIRSIGAESTLWITSIFNNTQATEEEHGVDLAEFSAEEVGAALSTHGVITTATISNRIPLVVRYKKWCMDKGLPAVLIRSEEIKVDVSDNVRNTMVFSPSHLNRLLKQAFPDKTKKSSNCVYRSYLWMGFSGMQAEDAASVRVSDVDLKSRMIYFNNRWYIIPEEGIGDIKLVCSLTEFARVMRGKTVLFGRADGDRILRGRKLKKEITVSGYVNSTLRPKVQAGFKEAGHEGMSFIRVRKSGIFYEMFRREVRGFAINFATVAHDDYLAGDYKEDKPGSKQKTVRRIMLMYERDYESWKKAFRDNLMEEFKLKEMPDAGE